MASWTIRQVLQWTANDLAARGVPSPRLDTELLLSCALGIDRVRVYMDLDKPLSAAELDQIRSLVSRRRKREPVAYILGSREFYGRAFRVSAAVLIPRPETETLVEECLHSMTVDSGGRWLDLGVGSGAIAVTLCLERNKIEMDAVDVSSDALEIARANAEKHGVGDRIRFFEGDLFAALPKERKYTHIVSNPPYIPEGEIDTLSPDIAHFEPRTALAGGPDGLSTIRRILSQAPTWLEPGGHLLLEIGYEQASVVLEMFRTSGQWSSFEAVHDLSGIERVVHGILNPAPGK